MILIIIFVALILRLVNLNQSLWLDEAVQAITARQNFSYIFQDIAGDFHPPLYHFLMHFWVRFFGNSEIAMRLPSVLFGVATVLVLYKYLSYVRLKTVAILTALFLATSPFHIYYSQEARMYSMACFFAALSMYFFMKIKELTKLRINGLFILFFISTILMIYSDYYGFLVLLAQMIYLAIKRNYKFLLICLFAFLLVYLPWVPMLIIQLKTGMLASQTLPGWARLVNVTFWKAVPLTLIKFTIGRITIFNRGIYFFISLAIIVMNGFLIVKGFLKRKTFQISNFKFQIVLWFVVPLLISWLASLFIPNFQPFRLLLILPAFYLLLAEGISATSSKKLQFFVVGLFLTINLGCLSAYYSNPYFHREDWKGTVNFLLKQTNSKVLLPSMTSNWPIRYYDPDLKIKIIYGGKGINPINELTNYEINGLMDYEIKNVFYVRYLVSLFDPQELILEMLEKQGYTKIKEISFNQIAVWEYELTDYEFR